MPGLENTYPPGDGRAAHILRTHLSLLGTSMPSQSLPVYLDPQRLPLGHPSVTDVACTNKAYLSLSLHSVYKLGTTDGRLTLAS